MKYGVLIFFLLGVVFAQDSQIPQQQFDFWIGTWDVYKFDTDTLVGKSQITAILDGNAISEAYTSTQGPYKGTSLNAYNPQTEQWAQFYMDNQGLTLELKGAFKEGKMILEDKVNRITWQSTEGGMVRQTWQVIPTGQVVFDGEYRKRIQEND